MIRKIFRYIRVYKTKKAIRNIILENQDIGKAHDSTVKRYKQHLEESMRRTLISSPIPRHIYDENHFDKLVYKDIDFTKKS